MLHLRLWRLDEGPRSAPLFQDPILDQLADRLAHRHAADIGDQRQFAFGRKFRFGRQFPRRDGRGKVAVKLFVPWAARGAEPGLGAEQRLIVFHRKPPNWYYINGTNPIGWRQDGPRTTVKTSEIR